MILAILALAVVAPTDLVFVRHAETVANATGRYNTRTLNTFSKKGEDQVRALTGELLREPGFDIILVSPSPRALKTIAPYLKSSGKTAIVWPLLYECCTERPRQKEAATFSYGAKITLPSDIAKYFVLAPNSKLPAPTNFGQGLAQVSATEKEFRQKFMAKRVMLVGHSAHGGQLLHRLTGKWIHVQNADPIHIKLP